MEFRIWTMLIEQSRGALHVFLPLLDQGLDAVIHRMTDWSYIPVQVKSRGAAVEGMIKIVIRAASLVDDNAIIIAGLHLAQDIGPTLLVVDEASFKRLAAREMTAEGEVYEMVFGMAPDEGTHWRPYLVPKELLAQRLLGGPPPEGLAWSEPTPALEPSDRHNSWLGFLGEQEVIRRLAANPRLDLFRPFPDLEMVEVVARNNATGGFAGIQVKTRVPFEWGEAHFRIHKATFVPSANTFLAGLVWLPDTSQFADEMLLIPAADIPRVAIDSEDWWVLVFHPHSPERTRLDDYRVPLVDLADLIERRT